MFWFYIETQLIKAFRLIDESCSLTYRVGSLLADLKSLSFTARPKMLSKVKYEMCAMIIMTEKSIKRSDIISKLYKVFYDAAEK